MFLMSFAGCPVMLEKLLKAIDSSVVQLGFLFAAGRADLLPLEERAREKECR